MTSEKEIRQKTRRSFLYFGISAAAGLLGLRWIVTADADQGVPWILRKGLRANESFWRRFANPTRENTILSAPPDGSGFRINGEVGIETPLEASAWTLKYESPTASKNFKLTDLEKFPRVNTAAEFRCIEGWSRPLGYGGIPFADFLKAVDPEGLKMKYVGFETPDKEYYVSIDMESMLHPQTLLADRMNGTPLNQEHGAPLRLIIPIKYGFKSLKRVGRIFLSNERPPDYWVESGYDWYAGL